MELMAPILAAGGGSLNPLDFDPSAFMLTLITFVILFTLLLKFAWTPILNSLDARERRIEDSVNAAEVAKADAEKLIAEHQEKIRAAERDVADRIEEGRAAAERQAQDILDKAHEEAASERELATKDIELARQRALSDLRAESVRLSKLIAEKVIQRQINDEDHKRLADDVLSSMS